MKNKTIVFYDFEATGVSRDADPISLGIVAVTEKPLFSTRNGYTKDKYTTEIKTFYSEFTDFQIEKCDPWVQENIVNKLYLPYPNPYPTSFNNQVIKGTQEEVSTYLKEWLSQFEEIEFWADFDVIDKPMLIDLIANWDFYKKYGGDQHNPTCEKFKLGLPKHLPNIKYYDFYDLHTLIKEEGFDPDIDRKELAIESIADNERYNEGLRELEIQESKHNALYDAFLNWKVYEYLNQDF